VDSQRSSRDETIQTSVAESIGATLGTIAAKAGSVQKELTKKVKGAKSAARRPAATATKRARKTRRRASTKTKASATTAKRSKRNRKSA